MIWSPRQLGRRLVGTTLVGLRAGGVTFVVMLGAVRDARRRARPPGSPAG